MKIVTFAEVSPTVKAELKAANLYPITLTREDGVKVSGYLVEGDLFWGVKVEAPVPEKSK